MVFKAIDRAEMAKIPVRNHSFDELLNVVAGAVLKTSICLLLGLKDSSCYN